MRFDVLSRDVNVLEPHFLEASAGTGKTFAIEHLVVRQILEGLLVEEILVVTFTRAAARELKMRIRRCLERAQEQLESGDPALDYLKALCEQGKADEARLKIEAALASYDQAQIFTLHGFCHRILKEFAFEAGIGLEVSDPDDHSPLALVEEIVKEHLKEGIQAPDYSPLQLHVLINNHQRDAGKLIQRLVEKARSGKEIAPLPSFEALHAEFCRQLSALPPISAEKFIADIESLRPHYKWLTGKEVPVQTAQLAALLEKRSCDRDEFEALLDDALFLDKLNPGNLKVRAKLPSQLHYPELVPTLIAKVIPALQAARDPVHIFLRLAHDIKKKSDEALQSNETLSPDDLLLQVQKALQEPAFVERVRKKYRSAIIDEFQDTDPIQWDIFQKLFVSQGKAVCLVGDPKQSIYAFRSADLHTYFQAADAMGDAARKHLDTNYRSSPALVSALNLMFSQAEWMRVPGRGPLSVIPVQAGKPAADETQPPVTFFFAPAKRGKMGPEALSFMAAEILSLHQDKKVPLHEIAILVKDRYQGASAIEHLKKEGIPASFKRGAAITESAAFFALQELLAAVLAPHDMGKLKAALGGPLIGWDAARLLHDADALLSAKALMQKLQRVLCERGFGPFFKAFLKEAAILPPLLGRGELSLYLDLRKLCELCIEEEIERGLKADAFPAFLQEMAADAHLDEARLKAPTQEEKGSVVVMTMHMSKGLEFEAVFALGVAARQKESEMIVVKKEGKSTLVPFDPADPDCLQAQDEINAEKLRQLYVALTRAKAFLYIPYLVEEKESEETSPIELFFSALGSDPLALLGKETALFRFCHCEENPSSLKSAPPPSLQLPPLEPLQLPKWDQQLYSFSMLAKKGHASEPLPLPEDDAPSPHTLPHGSETGHALHLIFEKIFKRGLHHPLDAKGIEQAIDEEVAFSSLSPFKDCLLSRILDLLQKPIADFCLADLPPGSLQQEMEFFYPVEGGMMKGFADLFFSFRGKYYLLDWKSNYLGPTDADYTDEKIIEAMRQSDYFLQASIYAAAMQRFVKLFDNRPFSSCFGGAIYYFVRGKAPYHFIPEVHT